MIRFYDLFLLMLIGLIPTACEKDSHSHSEDHTDADGFIFEDESGNELYREFEGEIVTNLLTLSVGQTLELSVHFLNHDGNEIEHEESGGEHEDALRISENDSNIATIGTEEHCDELSNQIDCETSDHCEWMSMGGMEHCMDSDEEEHHELVIHITGVSIGSTSFKLELMHGNHADYTSTNNVAVTIINSTMISLY